MFRLNWPTSAASVHAAVVVDEELARFLSRDGLPELLERPVRGGARCGSRAKANGVRGVRGNAGAMPKNGIQFADVDDLASTRRRQRDKDHIETDFRRYETPKLVTQNQRVTGVKMASLVVPL